MSASLGAYLRPLAARLGIDDALAVELVAGADGIAHRRAGRRAQHAGPGEGGPAAGVGRPALRPATPRLELWAYGDSSGDEELLALADHPTWVGRRATRDLTGRRRCSGEAAADERDASRRGRAGAGG